MKKSVGYGIIYPDGDIVNSALVSRHRKRMDVQVEFLNGDPDFLESGPYRVVELFYEEEPK